MTNVTPLRPRPSFSSPEPVVLPSSIEAEQALVGSALVNNAVVERCPWLEASDFLEPVHGRIWGVIRDAVRLRNRVDPITLKRLFDHDPSLQDLDGAEYLARMARAADTIGNAVDYARHVKELSKRRELFAIADELRARALDPTERDDPASIMASYASRIEAVCLDETRPLAKHISEVIDGLEDRILNPPQMWRLGIPALDSSIGGETDDGLGAGVPEGYVIGFEARMKSFKSGCCHTALLALARNGVPSCYFALEMGSGRLAQRILGQVGGFNSAMFRFGDEQLLHRVRQAREMSRDGLMSLDEAPMYFIDQPGLRFSRLRAAANQMMRHHGVRAFVLDYWQLVQPDERVTNKADFLAEVAQWCADHAHEHNTTWFLASQENRAGESYGSDGLAKACDWLAVLHKHEEKMHLHPTGAVETLWAEVKHARDSSGCNIGDEDRPVLYINMAGPHLAQLPGT